MFPTCTSYIICSTERVQTWQLPKGFCSEMHFSVQVAVTLPRDTAPGPRGLGSSAFQHSLHPVVQLVTAAGQVCTKNCLSACLCRSHRSSLVGQRDTWEQMVTRAPAQGTARPLQVLSDPCAAATAPFGRTGEGHAATLQRPGWVLGTTRCLGSLPPGVLHSLGIH